ncbi:hypothetical protein IEQ34_006574 [Dendrobium chrysotoxum]|uniref:Uncharacterized protein n=1 Tax=Dendrobium chrysotoxum TaxID=161865 RepID=A0AAV7H8J2_DENCH|nr:hypothetical protein IEQ34_006574 [Dendrobium chrysotoxum]
MEAPEDFPVCADSKTIKYFYSKRNELVPPISRQIIRSGHLTGEIRPDLSLSTVKAQSKRRYCSACALTTL